MKLSVRELRAEDCQLIVDYFLNADHDTIRGMGADPDKLPEREAWIGKILGEYHKPIPEKTFFVMIWMLDGKAIGHNNLADIVYGKEAKMHLHIWDKEMRKKRFGHQLLSLSIPWFFKKFDLDKIICEPYALNPAPVRTLEKVGFKFKYEYETTPGYLNFPQMVKRFELNKKRFINRQAKNSQY